MEYGGQSETAVLVELSAVSSVLCGIVRFVCRLMDIEFRWRLDI